MAFPIDLKHFKKTSEDKHFTTLKHKNGHEIKLAHSALSEEMRKGLSKLSLAYGGDNPKLEESKKVPDSTPSYAKGGKVKYMADGGSSSMQDSPEQIAQDAQQPDQKAPVIINVGNPSPQMQAPSPNQQPQPSQASPQPSAAPQMASPNMQPNGQPAQPQQPQGSVQWSAPKTYGAPEPLAPPTIPPSPEQQSGESEDAKDTIKNAPQTTQNESTSPQNVSAPVQQQAVAQVPPVQAPKNAISGQPYNPADPKQQDAAHLAEEDAAWAHDLVNGHITPETYGSLFAKKDTLGKIGMIFASMVSGAGSALSNQPNQYLAMMQKQIDNDLNAQKQSKDNAQNFLRLNQQNLLNQANIKNINADTATKAYALAQNKMLLSSFHSLADNVNKMPDGPQKALAQNQLGLIWNATKDKIVNVNDQAAGAGAFYNTLFPSQSAQQNGPAATEQQFQQQTNAQKMLGPQGEARAADMEAKHIPGIPGLASKPIPEGARAEILAMNTLDNRGKDLMNFIQQHPGLWHTEKEKAQALQKVEEMKNFYNGSIKGGALTEGRLGWYDKQFSDKPLNILQQMMGSNQKFQEMINSNSARRDLQLQQLGFPSAQNAGAAVTQQQSTPEETRTDPKTGFVYKRGPNGEAIRIK